MVQYYAPPNFPFSRLFPLGVTLLVLGFIALALGVVDVVMTEIKYGDLCDPQTNALVATKCTLGQCKNPSYPFALAAPGIWTGFFTMVAGGVSASLMYASAHSLKSKRDGTGVLAGLIAFPLGPATLVISALRLYNMNNVFFCMDAADPTKFLVVDYFQFLIPIIVGFTIFLAWCLSLGILVALCRNGRLSIRDEFEYDYGRRYREPDPYDASFGRTRRPYMIPDHYENKFYERPRMSPWRDRAMLGWRDPSPYSHGYPSYATGARSEPYPSYARRYMDNPNYHRGYYTTKTYNRYT